ncbi:MAG: hypothetical protein HZB44_03790 [Actinobacteria bacterium]|nr:hypothetical protein [Actinomycetota bacterium]
MSFFIFSPTNSTRMSVAQQTISLTGDSVRLFTRALIKNEELHATEVLDHLHIVHPFWSESSPDRLCEELSDRISAVSDRNFDDNRSWVTGTPFPMAVVADSYAVGSLPLADAEWELLAQKRQRSFDPDRDRPIKIMPIGIFNLELDEPIKPMEAQWVSWEFEHPILKRDGKAYYELLSPFELRDRFRNQLHIPASQARLALENQAFVQAMGPWVEEENEKLREFISVVEGLWYRSGFEEMIEQTTVYCHQWECMVQTPSQPEFASFDEKERAKIDVKALPLGAVNKYIFYIPDEGGRKHFNCDIKLSFDC